MTLSRSIPLSAGAALLWGCGDAAPSPAAALEDVLSWGSPIVLEENPEVINVTPTVSLERSGGFVIADEREGQVRRYGREGALLWHAGSKGSGPGEYRSLSVAVRLASGEVLAAERRRSMSFYDSAGTLVRTIQSGFSHVEDMDVVDDSTVVISAVANDHGLEGPRIHVWDPRTNVVRRSFFAPLPRAPNQAAAMMAGWTRVAVRGDTVAAIFALSDTLYFFDLDGRALETVPLSFSGFRPVPAETPDGGSDPLRRAQWFSTFDYVADVHWLDDGTILAPYQSIQPDRALTRSWHLFGTNRRGDALFEVRDVPRLLAVDERRGELYFVTPGSETPNQWTVAHLRR